MTLGYTPIKMEEPRVLLTFTEHLTYAVLEPELAECGSWLAPQKRLGGDRQVSNYTTKQLRPGTHTKKVWAGFLSQVSARKAFQMSPHTHSKGSSGTPC